MGGWKDLEEKEGTDDGVMYLTKDTVKSEVLKVVKKDYESKKTGLTVGDIVKDMVDAPQEEYNKAVQKMLKERYVGILCSELAFSHRVRVTKGFILTSIGNIYSGVELGKMFVECICNEKVDVVSEYISDESIAVVGESLKHLANSSEDDYLLCAFDILRVLCVYASNPKLKYYKCTKLPLNDIAEILKSSFEDNIDTLKYKVNFNCVDQRVMFGREEPDMTVREIMWCDVERYTGVKIAIGVDSFVPESVVGRWWNDKREKYKSL